MINSSLITLLQILVVAPLTYLLTKLMVHISNATGFVNRPNQVVNVHQTPIAYGGGVAISVPLIIFLVIQSTHKYFASEYALVLLPVIIFGLLDDLFQFKPLIKFILQLTSAIPFLLHYSDISLMVILIMLMFILFVQNAWNLIDVMDGLLAGISIIIFLSIGLLLTNESRMLFYSELAIFTSFSILGFRFLNTSPAKIFLGETGSILLGSLYAFIVISIYFIDKLIAGYIFLLGVIPYFELVFLMIVRTRKGIPFFRGSPDHIALRLLNSGASIQSINKFFLIICSIHASIVVLTSYLFDSSLSLMLCGCFSLLLAITGFFYFNFLPAREQRNDN